MVLQDTGCTSRSKHGRIMVTIHVVTWVTINRYGADSGKVMPPAADK